MTSYSRHAHWLFHEQVSLATHEFRQFSAQKDAVKATTKATAKAAKVGQQVMELMMPTQQPKLVDESSVWIATIKRNIVEQLASGPFVVCDHIFEIYRGVFGFARSMHVRAAIKELYDEGVTLCDGVKKGNVDVPDFTITRGPQAPPLNPPTTPQTPDTET